MELRLFTGASAVDGERRIVATDEGEEIPYEICVLATGSEPVRPPLRGGDDPEILTMRTIENSTRLQNRVGERDRPSSWEAASLDARRRRRCRCVAPR